MELPSNLMMISGLLTFDRMPDVEHLSAIFEHRLCRYERFRCQVVEPALGLGLPSWQLDHDFRVENHLRVEKLDKPLMERVGELMSEPLDRSRPLWEFRLFPNVDGGAALLGRLHHAIGDGIALMRVLLNLGDSQREAPWPEATPQEVQREPREGPFEKAKRVANQLLHEGHDLLFHPSQASQLARQGLQASQALARLVSLSPDQESVFRGPLQNRKVAAVSPPLELAPIKALGKRLGCTINDILMGTLAGGLGRSLARWQSVPSDLQIRAVVPVDLRAGQADHLGNHFGLVFLELPVGEPHPGRRLQKVRQNMQNLKESAEAVVAFELLSAVGMVPAEIEKWVIQWFGNKATAVVTNLPGPRERLYLAGARVDSVMYWVPQSGRLGLGVSVLSYADQVRVGIASDAELIPHPEYLVEDFLVSYQELAQLEAL